MLLQRLSKSSEITNKINMVIKRYIDIPLNYIFKNNIYYIVEPADWVIKQVGINLKNNLNGTFFGVTNTHIGIRNSLIHYGSKYTFFQQRRINIPHKSNKVVVTWYHVSPDDGYCIKLIPQALSYVKLWHTASSLTKNKLVELGIPPEKIVMIPLGVDLEVFRRPTEEERETLKKRIGLPYDKFIIGSFQKDGVGWREGFEPKLIKGPDIFCDVVERLSRNYDIFVLLSGPSRGYVKKRLEKARIPYFHSYVKNHNDIPDYYKVIDIYLVTAREEGGPQALVESLATGVPLVTTNVGMASDIIKNGENGFLVEVEKTEDIIKRASELIENKNLRERFIVNGLESVKQYDWKNIAQEYRTKILKACRL